MHLLDVYPEIPLKVYELLTGKRVDPREAHIGGGSRPSVLRYEYYGTYDYGPGGEEFASTARSDVRDACGGSSNARL